jgi:hypothetical protein
MPQPDKRTHLNLAETLKVIERNLLLGVPMQLNIHSSGDCDKIQVSASNVPLAQVEITHKTK